MSNGVSIFKQQSEVIASNRAPSALSQELAKSSNGITSRRIQTNTNGTFKRLVNGEQIGDAIRGEINVIIVWALPTVSRVFYKEKYDPKKDATLPNCWSNMGDKPEESALDPQGTSCATCPQNIKGSGENGGRACRFQRRISVLVEGDKSGDIYQFNIPAKSLFGKGVGNVHPFESYLGFLSANKESPDNIVTTISYDLNADSMELLFSPVRNVSDAEYELVLAAQANPEAKRYTQITVAQADNVKKLPPAAEAKPVVTRSDEPDDEPEVEEIQEPVKRASKKDTVSLKDDIADVLSDWANDE
jgi:hypothetical protein